MNPSNEALAAPAEVGLDRRVARNAAWLFVGRVGSQGLSMLFVILVARQLGANGLGLYAFMTSVVFLGNLGTTFGTDMLIVREVAAKRDLSLLAPSLLLQIGLSVLFVLAAFFFASFIPKQSADSIQALQLYTLSLLPLAFYSVFSSALRGVERMDSFTWLNVASGAVLLFLGLAFVRPSSTAMQLAVILLVGQTVSAILAGIFCFTSIPNFNRSIYFAKLDLARVLKLSAPIAVLGILGAIYQRMAIYLLSALDGQAATGLFSAALRIVEAAKIGHVALLSAMLPAMSQAAIQMGSAVPKLQKTFFGYLMTLVGLAILIAVILSAFATPLVQFLYGGSFDASAAVLVPLSWVLLPMTISHYISLRLIAAKRERPIMLALFASIALLVLLIPPVLAPAGLTAIAWVMLGAEILQAIILVIAWSQRSI